MTDDTTPDPSAVLAAARRLSDAVAEYYRRWDSTEFRRSEVDSAQEKVFAVQAEVAELLAGASPRSTSHSKESDDGPHNEDQAAIDHLEGPAPVGEDDPDRGGEDN